jgi:predicted nucleic acid-binding protein
VVGLLDVNVLVALFVPEHQHHELALNWFAATAATGGWATCAVTELGVIRVCAQLSAAAGAQVTADRLLMLTARRGMSAGGRCFASGLAGSALGEQGEAGD